MNEEVLIALNDLTNGALNYYQAIETVMVRKQVIENYIKQLQQENQKLKKQLEELDKKLFFTKNELDMRQKSIDNKLNQQKEFIEYLENESILHQQYGEYTYYGYRRKIIGEILSKYKEIIGENKCD